MSDLKESAFAEFFAECEEILQRVTQVLTQFETSQIDQDSIDGVYRDIHTLKGTSQLFGFKSIGLVAHGIEASLEPVRQGKIALDKSFVDIIFKCLDLIDRILKEPERDLEGDQKLQTELAAILPQLIGLATAKFDGDFFFLRDGMPDESIEKNKVEGVTISSEVTHTEYQVNRESNVSKLLSSDTQKVKEQVPTQRPTMEKITTEEIVMESSTIRVQVNLLDKLMNLVGEMVLTRNQVLQYSRSSEDNEFHRLTQRLDLVTSELQDNVMRTRMQPIGSIFNKFQRVVRDLSKDLGKNIDLVIQGAETELDKSLIEAIKDPLTHIVRNSCDHGIEQIEERKKAGKSEMGVLTLKAFHEGGQIIIEIRDDGRGIDPVRVKAKAIEKRILSPDRANSLSDKEAQELIFAPGFSTADSVSSVSGRGVGMDVVRTNVEKVGGVIELESTPGKGTILKLRIPLTLAIVPAMIIRSDQEYFAIPQVKLQELLRVDMEEDGTQKVERLQGFDVYRLRGELLPLISCQEVMNTSTRDARSVYNIVVLNGEPHPFGLIVDEICDTADIVVKPLPTFLKKTDIFSGATIMGDGSVALIMDTQGFADHMNISDRTASIEEKGPQATGKLGIPETTEFLFFKLSHSGVFAIPLVLVHRLEEFSMNEVDFSGEERLIKYRESLLPLIFLNDYFGYKAITDVEKLSVVVVSKNNRLFGLVVNEIVDVLTSVSEVTPHIRESKGLLGTIISQDKSVITVIDAFGIVDDSMGVQSKKKIKRIKPATVLLAEDTMFFAKQIKKVLEETGLVVTHAPDGAEAFKLLKKKGQEFDLVVSDIEMPNMNGFDLASSVRSEKELSEMPMIALTTRFTETDRKKGKDAGFNKYLEKLRSDELLEAIHEILEGR